jgi:hypothetical protein
MSSFFQELRLGARQLRKSPLFMLVLLAMLGLAISAKAAIFFLGDG